MQGVWLLQEHGCWKHLENSGNKVFKQGVLLCNTSPNSKQSLAEPEKIGKHRKHLFSEKRPTGLHFLEDFCHCSFETLTDVLSRALGRRWVVGQVTKAALGSRTSDAGEKHTRLAGAICMLLKHRSFISFVVHVRLACARAARVDATRPQRQRQSDFTAAISTAP